MAYLSEPPAKTANPKVMQAADPSAILDRLTHCFVMQRSRVSIRCGAIRQVLAKEDNLDPPLNNLNPA